MRGIINVFNSFADINECKEGMAQCSVKASCTNTPGSFSCKCIAGYQGDGKNCLDKNECSSGQYCARDADCRNTDGSYVGIHPASMVMVFRVVMWMSAERVSIVVTQKLSARIPGDHTVVLVVKDITEMAGSVRVSKLCF